MLISVVCPSCRETYQVHDALRGKSMRCLKTTCRRLFVIDDKPAASGRAAPTTQFPRARQTGSVGDVIPILPVEEVQELEVAEVNPATPQVGDVLELVQGESADDADALPLELVDSPPDVAVPPPAQRTRGAPRETKIQSPRVVEPGSAEAPPVRRGPPTDAAPPPRPVEVEGELEEVEESEEQPPPRPRPAAAEPQPHEEEEYKPRRRGRWAKWVVAALLLLTVGGLGGGAYVAWQQILHNEDKLARKADDEFDKNQFRQAGELYEQLARRYSTSENAPRYAYRKDLSDLRQRLAEPSDDLGEEFDHTSQFLTDHDKGAHLPPDAAALGGDLARVLIGFAERSAKDVKDEEPLKTLERAGPVIARMKSVKLPKDTKAPGWSKVDEAFAGLRQNVARMKERNRILTHLRGLAKMASYRGIVELENYLKEVEAQFPELPASAEVRRLIEEQRAGHLASARFVTVPNEPRKPVPADDDEPALLLDPPVQTGDAPGRDGIGLALARGLLCAVSRKTGEVRWSRRVGIDITALPVRVPARAGSAERLLVLSSDRPFALTALDLDGNMLWRYPLPSPVLGRPVVVEQRAYLATYEDGVHEIELIEGKLLGKFQFPEQRLTLGGVREPNTNRVYFPAADGCVYLVDVAERRCERILYTRHPAGSLRNNPIVVPPQGEDGPGFLILEQADGLDGVRLRVYDLPVRDSNAREVRLQPPASLEGWTWFDIYPDPEKLILVSDAGRMGLFGIKQAHNRDQALFPLLPGGSLDLLPMLFPPPEKVARSRGRSEIVQAQGDEMWVLALGRLQRLRLAWGNAVGPRVVSVWPKAMEVGSPIHASQTLEDLGKTSLLTVTQPPRRSCVWLSHFDDDRGQLHWRRQLGLVCQGEPIPLPAVGAGGPVWLACDQAGALVALDPTLCVPPKDKKGIFRVANVLLESSLEENPDQPPLLLPADDGKSAFAVACPGDGRELVLRHVQPAAGRKLEVVEARVRLLSPLAGPPTLVGAQLMLAFTDGSLARLRLPLAPMGAVPEGGRDWRGEGATPDARCHLIALGGARFLYSNGGRGLSVCEWQPGSNVWADLPEGRDGPTIEMPGRVTGVVLLPGETPRVAVTDSTQTITLLEVTDKGDLVRKRSWPLGGQSTAGPFVRATKGGARLACIVDRSRLVWIDPAAESVVWTYTTPGSNALVGEPQVADEAVIVADGSGLYMGIDVRTGRPIGEGYRLKGSLAPAAGAVPFQVGKLLAPLSDGTLMLLGAEKLRGAGNLAPAGP